MSLECKDDRSKILVPPARLQLSLPQSAKYEGPASRALSVEVLPSS
jgi:hypothetical protein